MVKLERDYYQHCGLALNLVLVYLERVEKEGYPSYGIENVLSYYDGLELYNNMAENGPDMPLFTYDHALVAYAAADISSKLLSTEQGAAVAKEQINQVKQEVTEEEYLVRNVVFTTLNTNIMELLKPQLEHVPEFKELEVRLAALSL